MHAFLILAAGKSSRFGGYPKAFCRIGDRTVAQRTVDLGSPFFDRTYLAINHEIYPEYKDAVRGCAILPIVTGQGDAHSFLRAARLIRAECGADQITLCWGDTFYTDDSIFRRAAETATAGAAGVSLSAVDPEPYAWYETDGDWIRASRFRNRDGIVRTGIHDQSVFVFDSGVICTQLESYMKALGIKDGEDGAGAGTAKEMRMLDSFTYFYERPLIPVKYALVEPGRSFSFNTREELEQIREKAAI